MDISVIIIAKNRESHLRNLLKGLAVATGEATEKNITSEVVVVHMNEEPREKPQDFAGDYTAVRFDSDFALPIPHARNYGASIAEGELLIFLDIDCIPGPKFLLDYFRHFKNTPRGILMGSIYYLPASLGQGWDIETLERTGKEHPKRTYLTGEASRVEADYSLLWGLNITLAKSVFIEIGEFDIAYHGYAGEDTDLAQKAKSRGINLYWIQGANIFHQYHQTFDPPLFHFEDIIRNSSVFKNKWGFWPMQKWLKPFAELGLIRWSSTSRAIEILREPTPAEVENSLTS